MQLNVVYRGIAVNVLLNFVMMGVLVHYQFSINPKWFTFMLLVVLFLVCWFSAKRTQAKGAELQGVLIGFGSVLLVLLSLIQQVKYDWGLNCILLFIWGSVGYFGGLLGRRKIKKNIFERAKQNKKMV